MDFDAIRDRVQKALDLKIKLNQEAWELAFAKGNFKTQGDLNSQYIGLVDAKCIVDQCLRELQEAGLRHFAC